MGCMKNPTCLSLSAGRSHSAYVTGTNEVFIWGNGRYGQLGLEMECTHCESPRCLSQLNGQSICKVRCEQISIIIVHSYFDMYYIE